MTDLWDLIDPPAWMRHAKCAAADTDMFYAEQSDWETSQRAKEFCADCPVIEPCLQYANQTPVEVYGVWGGMTSKERQNLRRRNRRNAA